MWNQTLTVLNGHKKIVQVLLDNGAEIDHQDQWGWTALMNAGT